MTTLLNLDPSQVPDDGNSLVYNAASKKWLPGAPPFSGVDGLVYSQVATDGTDQTAALQAELDALYAAGGGTLVLPAGVIVLDGQIVFPNDGGGIFPTDAQIQPSMTLAGQGGWHTGQQQGTPTVGGTVIRCNHQSGTYNDAKLVTRGLGRLTIRDITFRSHEPTDQTPFIMTTSTTVHILGCSFRGAGPSASPALDAIVLGGTKKKANGVDIGYDDPDSAFQGYGSVVARCYFDRIRRAVYGRSYANHVVVRDCFMEKTCGTNLVGGACVEFNGNLDVPNGSLQPGDYCTGDQILNNYMNGLGYYYQVKLVQATRCVVFGNGSPDPQANLVALVGCFSGIENAVTYPARDNQIVFNHAQEPLHLHEDAASTGLNQIIGGGTSEGAKFRGNFAIEPGSQNPAQIGKVNFTGAITSSGTAQHQWTVESPITALAAPWRLRGGGIDWLSLSNGASPQLSCASRFSINGNTTTGSGSTMLSIGNNNTDADAEILLNPPTGRNSTVKFQYAGTNRWQIYNGAGATSLYVRDMTAAVMALTFTTGTGNTGSATFIGSVNAGRWVRTQAVATSSRPSASTAGAGAMMFDSTLNKPIWSTGSAWVDATGTTV